MLPVTKVNSMKQKEIVLTLSILAEKGACNRGIEEFKKWYPSGSAPLSEVLRKLQELANTSTDYVKYVEYAIWLRISFPSTQEPLVLNELTEKVIIHNGDVTINCDIDGDYVIIVNGNLNIKGDANLTGRAVIWAKNVKAINITLDFFADIRVEETIDTINIEAYEDARIEADEINTQYIMDDDGTRIHGKINLIRPSSNQQNTTTAS